MSSIGDLLELVAILIMFGVGYSLVQSLFGSFDLESFLLSTLPLFLFAIALIELAIKLKTGSQKSYLITLVLFAMVIDANVAPLFDGNPYSLIAVCLGAAVLIYLTDRDVRGYFFPIPVESQ